MSSYHNGACAELRAQVDAAAEREGEAIDWLWQEADVRPYVPFHVCVADLIRMADELGHRPEPPPRYPRGAALRRHWQIIDAVANNEPLPVFRFDPRPTGRAARAQRQAEYRAGRAANLGALSGMDPDHALTLRQAASFVGLSLSGLEKARLPRVRYGGRAFVRAGDVLAFLRRRLRIAA